MPVGVRAVGPLRHDPDVVLSLALGEGGVAGPTRPAAPPYISITTADRGDPRPVRVLDHDRDGLVLSPVRKVDFQ